MKHATVKGATGVKIVGRDDLEKALAGLPLYVARRDDEVEYFKDLLERKRIKLTVIRVPHVGTKMEDFKIGRFTSVETTQIIQLGHMIDVGKVNQ